MQNHETEIWLQVLSQNIRDLSKWADDKLGSSSPASPAEVELIEKVNAELAKLKTALKNLSNGEMSE